MDIFCIFIVVIFQGRNKRTNIPPRIMIEEDDNGMEWN